MTDLAAIRDELRTLLEKASELPWKRDERYIVGQVRGGRPGGEVIATAGMTWKGHDGDTPENREADAALIVAAVNALPALLADTPSVEPAGVETWRHAGRCETERGGAEVDCTCGLTAFRSALLPTQASDSPANEAILAQAQAFAATGTPTLTVDTSGDPKDIAARINAWLRPPISDDTEEEPDIADSDGRLAPRGLR